MAYVCLNGIFSDLSPLSIHSMPGSGVKADLCEGYDCSVQILAIVFPVRPFTAIRSHLVPLGNHSCKLKCTFISRKMSFLMQSRYYPFWHRLCSNLWINSITVLKWCIFTPLPFDYFCFTKITNKSLFYFKKGQKDNGHMPNRCKCLIYK